MQTAQRKKSLVSLVSSTRLKLQMEKVSEVASLVLTRNRKFFFSFFRFFFNPFNFYFFYTHTKFILGSSYFKGFSLFRYFLFVYYYYYYFLLVVILYFFPQLKFLKSHKVQAKCCSVLVFFFFKKSPVVPECMV